MSLKLFWLTILSNTLAHLRREKTINQKETKTERGRFLIIFLLVSCFSHTSSGRVNLFRIGLATLTRQDRNFNLDLALCWYYLLLSLLCSILSLLLGDLVSHIPGNHILSQSKNSIKWLRQRKGTCRISPTGWPRHWKWLVEVDRSASLCSSRQSMVSSKWKKVIKILLIFSTRTKPENPPTT